MDKTNSRIIDWLLSSGRSAAPISGKTSPEFDSFRKAFFRESALWQTPADRAVAGGFISDCAAFAFAAGYRCALERLIPALPQNTIACFCITEEGGGHPRAIRSQLSLPKNNDGKTRRFTLNGKKKYVTCATEADLFLVAASDGIRDDGRNSIRMLMVEGEKPGITIMPMKEVRLVPEISHGEILFTDVALMERDLLPGDGYTDYIKPFRTIEDLHVSAAILGYLFKNACAYDWGREIKENILGRIASVRALAIERPNAPETHIIAGDALKKMKELFKSLEPFWEKTGGEAKQAWDRDKILMNIADNARARRLQAAWEFYEKNK